MVFSCLCKNAVLESAASDKSDGKLIIFPSEFDFTSFACKKLEVENLQNKKKSELNWLFLNQHN